MRRFAVVLPVLSAALACSKTEPPPPERTEPWPAPQVASSAVGSSTPTQTARYRLDDRCALALELPAKQATPRGVVRVARGELDVDLMNLERTRGTIEIDVASIAMEAGGDGGSSDWDEEARAWLDVGTRRPESERERLRWATFSITSVSEPSASAAHEGKRVKLASDGGADATSDAAPVGEQRAVTATATGQLALHGFRVERSLRVRAIFRYAAPAVPGAVPGELRLELVRPFSVSLMAHDIKPRDPAGVFVAQKTKLLGVQVGREARVRGWLEARLSPDAKRLD